MSLSTNLDFLSGALAAASYDNVNIVSKDQGIYIKEMTSENMGLNWFFQYTFSLNVVSEIDNSNIF